MADAKINQSVLNNLLKFFKIGFKKSGQTIDQQVFPLKATFDAKKGYTVFDKEQFPDETKRLFQWWATATHDSIESWKTRNQLFQDCDLIYYNCAMLAKSMEIISDEVVQADLNMQPIAIEAKRDVKKFITEFFDKIGLYGLIRPTILDIVRYGNAGWILGFDDDGISEIVPIDMYNLKERLEFTPAEVEQKMKGDDIFFSQFASVDRIQQLIASIQNKENVSSYFKSYLFGFQIGDKILPPWRFIHFRNFTNSSPFRPYGVPVFIHSIAPYRQWDAAMTMQIVARGAKFPKEVYKLKISNAVDPSTKLQMATEFLNELQNSGIGTTKKELPGINEIRITIDDLFSWEQETPQIDLDKIDDIQMLLDEVANSTFLPRNLIDPRDSGFGDSGVSLVEKWKPFARLVFRMQSTFLANLSQVIKIHMIHSNKFSMDEMDFVLSMPYPESQINQEIVQSQNSQWELANNIIASLSDKLLGGESLPTEVVKQVYLKILPYDDATIDELVAGTLKAREENDVKEYEKQVTDENQEIEQQNAFAGASVETSQNDREKEGIDKEKETLEKEKDNLKKDKDDLKKDKDEEKEKEANANKSENFKANKRWKMLEKEMGREYLKEKVDEEILKTKQETLREGIFRGRHFFSSKNIYTEFPAEQLREFDKQRLQKMKLKEQMTEEEIRDFEKTYYEEEIKYDFLKEKEKSQE
jgi:hypothetical protein